MACPYLNKKDRTEHWFCNNCSKSNVCLDRTQMLRSKCLLFDDDVRITWTVMDNGSNYFILNHMTQSVHHFTCFNKFIMAFCSNMDPITKLYLKSWIFTLNMNLKLDFCPKYGSWMRFFPWIWNSNWIFALNMDLELDFYPKYGSRMKFLPRI
jgi:hypothetical protein